MSRLTLFAALLAATLTFGGCVKVEHKIEFNADNTAKMTQSMSYSQEAVETLIDMADSMGGGGQDLSELENLESQVTEETVRKEMKAQGVAVTKFEATEDAGWKGFEMTGEVKDVNAWLKKVAKKADAEMAGQNPFASSMGNFTPRFYKTDKQGVGKIVVIPPMEKMLGGQEMPDLDDLSEEELDQLDMQLEMMKSMFAMDQMSMRIEVVLPGKILSTTGAKKIEGKERAMAFQMKGADFNVDSMQSLFGLRNGVSATFQIPEDCKIEFLEEKKEEGTTPAKDEAEEEKKPEKGGLKVGGDK